MIVIPAIDILNNQVVRLQKGDYSKVTVYSNSVREQAELYGKLGFNRVHLVDLLGSKTGKINILDDIKNVKSSTNLKIEFGGGIRKFSDAETAIKAGTDYLIIGSISVKNKEQFEKIVENAGADKVIVAADVIDEKIAVKGWTEKTNVTLWEHVEYCSGLGVNQYLCTDISQDGMLTGPSYELYEKMQDKFSKIKLLASGGVSKIEDVIKLNEMNMYGVIVGKAIYEKKIKLEELVKIGK